MLHRAESDAPAAVDVRTERATARAKSVTRTRGTWNPLMQLRRRRAVQVLQQALRVEKEEVLVAMLGVSRTLLQLWLRADASDYRPAALAMLLACDDEAFERVVDELRKARSER